MEKSFTSWRESTNPAITGDESDDDQDKKCSKNILVYDSDVESDSEIVESSSNIQTYVPDSDESFISKKSNTSGSIKKKSPKVVPDSDDEILSDEVDDVSHQSLSGCGATKPYRKSKKKTSYSSNHSVASSTPKLSDRESSPEITKSAKRNNKNRLISSDEEDNSLQGEKFNISNLVSDKENCSSTSVNKDKSVIGIEELDSTHSGINSFNISFDESLTKDKNELNASNLKALTKIDLTLAKDDRSFDKASNKVDLTKPKSSFTGKGGIITISSDSEDDKLLRSQKILAEEEELNAQLTKVNISKHDHLSSLKEDKKAVQSGALPKISENDYSSRLESLRAEQTRLDVQVREVLKNIDSVKSTLRTANMAALPDRGVRLQLSLKKFESQLRDLRYQQNTLSNEIIRLQLMANNRSVPKPIQPQPSQQKMFKLPTSTTDINAMGKKAMETHRTQQALTVDALRMLHTSLKNCPSEDSLCPDPVGLKVQLMPHQKYALSWLLWRESEKPSGGILADDMGLGKTLTLISLILKSKEKKQEDSQSDESSDEHQSSSSNWLSSKRPKLTPGKTLVVCPASLLGQWEGEVSRRVQRGIIDVQVHHGQSREKSARRLAKVDLVVTTYNIVSRDADQSVSPLFQIKWERIILDEAHQIRNHKTKTAQAAFQLKARSRWVLTGTPVQNKELDLYALLKFLRCSPFDDLGVWKTWVDNRDAAGQQRLNTIIKSIMLRRTKKGLQEVGELKNLPEKEFSTVMIKMDKEEWAVYEKLLNFSKTLFAQFLHQKAEKENALQGIPLKPSNLQHAEDPFKDHPELNRLHRQMKEISDVKSHHILVLLLRLRQFCCHPSLIQTMLEKDDVSNVGIEDADGLDLDLMDKMTRMSIVNQENQESEDNKADLTAMDKNNPLFSKDRISSKLRKVLETIEAILERNDKLLVVSQWVTHLDLVHSVLREKNIKCMRLTGQIPVKDRAEIVEKFNRKDHGPRVLLLSLTAGGVGLNLVGANHLLLLDLHWNPQLENQACDRIYRVGQEKNVQIYKFVTSETVEESVLNLQKKKLNVADSVLTGAKISSKLTLEDLKELFKFK